MNSHRLSSIGHSLNHLLLFVTLKRENVNMRELEFPVGKKLGNAVVRNKIKRQVRSMVDDCFDFNEAFDTIIIVRPSLSSAIL